jgi:DNA-binding transcriptional LysR family regulator
MQPLNTTRLKTLREVAARGTITAAAEALHLTGPAVSHQIGTLERELGVQLLERTPRSVRLTEAGRLLVRRAETILAECEVAVAEVTACAGEIGGLVKLSQNEVPYELHALTVLRLRERQPALEVDIVSMEPSEALAALRVGELDIVLSMEWECRPATPHAGTVRHDLLTDSYVVALPPAHPLADGDGPLQIRDLAHERWCLPREPRFRDALERTMRAAGIEPRPVFEGTNIFGIGAACAMGLGIGVIPKGADVILSGVVVRPLDEPDLTRQVFALVRAGSERSPAIRTVLEAMDEGAKDAIRRGVGPLPAAGSARD